MNLLREVLVFFLDNLCLERGGKRMKNRKEIFIQSFSIASSLFRSRIKKRIRGERGTAV